ncbi:MAG: DUF2069 domain-containing protein [Candidatus Liptonbacteria bacterium]|nr:DUF2069 domain-containing protein [Candidatus Liptonbacteria bacterium]
MRRSSKILLVLFFAGVFLASFNQLKESDSFYHLKVGQVIWETQSVPDRDIFSYTAPGSPWVTHEWLAELLLYVIYKLGGFGALIGFVALLATFTYWLILQTALRRGANIAVTLITAIFLAALTFELWIPRPQVFAFLCFGALLFFLEEFRRVRNPKFLLGVVGIIWFWANVHASVLLGLVILLLYVLFEALKLQWPGLGRGLPQKEVRQLAGGAGIAVLASLVNPNSYEIFFYRAAVEPAVQALQVLEWKSIFYFLPQREPILFLMLMVFSLAVILMGRWVSAGRRDVTLVAATLAVFILPILSIRHVGLWPIIAIPIVAVVLTEFGEHWLRRLNQRGLRWGLYIGLSLFLLVSIARIPGTYVRRDTLPVGAAEFVLKENLKGPILNLYNEGGYLIWKLWPKEKVFIDGRSEVYDAETITDLFRIVGRQRGWENVLLGKYHVNVAILPYRHPSLARDTVPLSFALEQKGFHLVYWDDAAMVLVRENIENRQFIEKFRLRIIHPFRDPRTIPEEERKAAGAEIQALLSRAPDSPSIQEYAKWFLTIP